MCDIHIILNSCRYDSIIDNSYENYLFKNIIIIDCN